MASLDKALFNLKFTAKQLNRQAAKAGKDEQTEKNKLKKAIQQGHGDIAKIYAQNAIRKQNERLNLLRLGSRIDAVSSRVQTAVTMRHVTGSMRNVVVGMDKAMASMDVEKVGRAQEAKADVIKVQSLMLEQQISGVMDKFESQFEDLDVATGYYENATSQATATSAPQEAVDDLMSKVAAENGLEMNQEMAAATPPTKIGDTEQREEELGERLRKLRA